MRILLCVPFLIFLATAVAQQAPMSTWMTHQAEINGNEGLALTDKQVAAYSEQALEGSGTAANKLGVHFLASRNNREMSEYWYHISAEDGDSAGEFSYGSMILEDSIKNRMRAGIWLKKSAAQGDDYARRRLQQILH
jgi:TPR repeat protein